MQRKAHLVGKFWKRYEWTSIEGNYCEHLKIREIYLPLINGRNQTRQKCLCHWLGFQGIKLDSSILKFDPLNLKIDR